MRAESDRPLRKVKTKERLSDRWIFSRPIDSLFAKLQEQLSAEGQVQKARALRLAMDDQQTWIQVQIRGEGEHRYGFLPFGSLTPALDDPTPVDRPDSWDF